MRRRRALQTIAAALTASLAGCGQGEDGTDPEPADGETETATPTEAATGTPADSTPEPTEEPAGETTDASEATSPPPTTHGDSGTTAASTDGDTPTSAETPEGADQVVRVGPDSSVEFRPDTFEISTGDTVVWNWRGDGHNVRVESAPDGTDWTGTSGDAGDLYDEGHTHSHTFTTPGEYEYFCAPHEALGMTGSFTVTE